MRTGSGWLLALLLALGTTAAAADGVVRAVVDHEGAVIACRRGASTLNAVDCPLGPALVTEFVDATAGRFEIVERGAMLRRGLPRNMEGLSMENCAVVIADPLPAPAPAPSPRAVATLTIRNLAPPDARLQAAIDEALHLRRATVTHAVEIGLGSARHILFVASNQAEAMRYFEASGYRDTRTVYMLAGFLRRNSDGSAFATILYDRFEVHGVGDSQASFALLGLAVLDGELRVVQEQGTQLARRKVLADEGGGIAAQPYFCN